ncbi:MAG TPA: MnhB domain-containing protein [Solirubrobacteraceae bacterium]|nr:MnhB domain-containing protein [Solirubrobacteraceae bacterium]
MTRTARLLLFGVAAVGLGVVLVYGLSGLPAFGHYHGVYGHVLDGLGVTERHATDLVTALNFDFRGFDTLGEEFILFASVLGVVLILRETRGEHKRPRQHEADEHPLGGASEALAALSLALIPAILAIGVYIVVHGQITPGGGFQGGVILAAGPLAVFLAGRYVRMRIVAPAAVVEIGEAAGALGYGMVGLAGLVLAGVFFKDFLPLGIPGHLLSAGQIDLASVAVGLEVSGAFLVAYSEFFDQALVIAGGPKPEKETAGKP